MRVQEQDVAIEIHQDASVTFLGHLVDIKRMESAHFAVLRHLKRIRVYLQEYRLGLVGICNLQDAMFMLFSNLNGYNSLWRLYMRIAVRYQSIYSSRAPVPLPGNYNHVVQPGDVSPRHIVAFLADAVSLVRGAKLYSGTDGFRLSFDGDSTPPWSEIETHVSKQIRMQNALPDYQLFARYFAMLRRLRAAVSQVAELRHHQDPFEEIARARIHGNMKDLHRYHERLVNRIITRYAQVPESGWTIPAWRRQHEGQLRGLITLAGELKERLPPLDGNTSGLGYGIADGALRRWQEDQSEEENE